MTGSMRCGVTLVHYGSGAAGRPHPTRASARPTFPLGEGSRNAVQTCNVVLSYDRRYHPKPSPGGKVARLKPGRMRATCRAESVVYKTNPARYASRNQIHSAKPNTITSPPSPTQTAPSAPASLPPKSAPFSSPECPAVPPAECVYGGPSRSPENSGPLWGRPA